MEEVDSFNLESRASDITEQQIILKTIQKSIYKLFCKNSNLNEVAKNSSKKCKICSHKLPSRKISKLDSGSVLSEDMVGVVLQSLLVPQTFQNDKEQMENSIIVCDLCHSEVTKLVDVFLQLEDLRNEFDSMRGKIAHKVITNSIAKSEEEFRVWQKQAKLVENIYPSLVNLEETEASIPNSKSISSLELDADSSQGNLDDDKYTSAINEKYKKIHKSDKRLTQMSCVVVIERLKSPKSRNKLFSASRVNHCNDNDINPNSADPLFDMDSANYELDNWPANGNDSELIIEEDTVQESLRDSSTKTSSENPVSVKSQEADSGTIEIKTEDDDEFDIIMEKDVTFITTDKKLTKMAAVIVLDPLQGNNLQGNEEPVNFGPNDLIDEADIKLELMEVSELGVSNSTPQVEDENCDQMISYNLNLNQPMEPEKQITYDDLNEPRVLRERRNCKQVIESDSISEEKEMEDEDFEVRNFSETDNNDSEVDSIEDEDDSEDEITTIECYLCKKNFQTMYSLNRHLKNVHKIPESKIPELKKKARRTKTKNRKLRLTEFVSNVNQSVSEFIGPRLEHQCSKCINSYRRPENLKYHLVRVHGDLSQLDIPCPLCSARFKTIVELNSHKTLAHWRKEVFPVTNNSETATQMNEVDNEKSTETGITNSEQDLNCQNTSANETKIEKNEATKDDQPTGRILRKRKAVINLREIEQHSDEDCEDKQGNESDYNEQEDEDEEESNNEEEISEDDKVYTKGNSYLCQECSLPFKTMELLRIHFESKHTTEEEQAALILDKNCGVIRKRQRLARPKRQGKEINENTGKRKRRRFRRNIRMPCDLCKKTFNERYALHRHLRTVHKREAHRNQSVGEDVQTVSTDSKKTTSNTFIGPRLEFACWRCPNSYMLRGSLRVHLIQDHEVFGNVCYECHTDFKTLKELNLHKRTAHGVWAPTGWKKEDPKCKICGWDFHGNISFRRKHMFRRHGLFTEEPTLKCTHCDLVFNEKSILMKHKLKSHAVGSKEDDCHCEMCLRFFSSKKGLAEHKELVHSGDLKTYKCALCSDATEYLNAEGLLEHENSEEHQKEVNSRIFVYCNVCRKNFDGDTQALQDHLSGEEHKKEFEGLGEFERNRFCVPCRQKFDTFEELLEHEDTGVKHRFTCSEFRSNKNPKDSKLESPLICHACPKTYEHQSLLDRHILKYHPPSGFNCKICKETFSRSTDLVLHKRVHTLPKTFVCDKCGKKFCSERSLKVHIRGSHIGECKCEVCEEMFPSKVQLRRHIENKHNVDSSMKKLKRLECSYCDMSFKTVELVRLRKHMCKAHPKEHLEEKQHFCCVCFHIFATEDERNVHLDTHNHLKCHECDKYFLNKGHHESHMRIHTGERPFKCSLCDQSFKTNGHLSQHVNGVHKNESRKAAEDSE